MRVRVTTNAGTIAGQNQARAQRLPVEIQATLVISAIEVKRTAVTWSSGHIPTETLSAGPPGLNHPLGIGSENRRGPRGPKPYGGSAIWNRQNGVVVSMWQTQIGQMNGANSTIYVRLYNTNPIAYWLNFGTTKMVARNVIGVVHEVEDANFTKRMLDAFRKAYGIK